MWIDVNRLRIELNGGILLTKEKTFGFHKIEK
jgi:hypothetical protein